ncbi:hypothetical protein [Amylibacter sp. IMCC11727]|uniref:hypothetical protein n=1 Tax=Amylibacter sp. IMCC11727 TaxID=3039851 RepID=UPI00244E0614|nr:hypothetical protein [Amylibacter sp. IMCC11727]WGI20897.1 hypothetical protein QBD29_12345 [Amylibacter sp. IMCC11727]
MAKKDSQKKIVQTDFAKPAIPPYRPDKFANTFAHLDGQSLWTWLHQEHVILIMETASYLRRPAIEPLSPLLKRHCPKVATSVKLRQMIGHMVRQILERRGYHLDRSNVRIKHKGNLFHFGSAYVKP